MEQLMEKESPEVRAGESGQLELELGLGGRRLRGKLWLLAKAAGVLAFAAALGAVLLRG